MTVFADNLPDGKRIKLPEQERLNFSFVIPGKLAGMAHPIGLDSNIYASLQFLQSQGIAAIVSLIEYPLKQEDIIRQQGFGYLNIPVEDFTAPTIDQADEFVKYVDERLSLDPPLGVVAHCVAGCGRTGTMLACYLVSQSLTADEAIIQTKTQRPCSIQSRGQLEFIYRYYDWWRFQHSRLQRSPQM